MGIVRRFWAWIKQEIAILRYRWAMWRMGRILYQSQVALGKALLPTMTSFDADMKATLAEAAALGVIIDEGDV